MKNKKIVFGIVLFLLIGLTVFTFANSKDNEKVLNPKPSVDDKQDDDDKNKPDQKDDQDDEVLQPINPSNPNYNGNTTYGPSYSVSDRLAYEDALILVEHAEETRRQEDLDQAYQLVEKLNYKKDELIERLNQLQDIIYAIDIIDVLELELTIVTNKEDMDALRAFKEASDITNLIDRLVDSTLQEELSLRLQEVSTLIDDVTSPVVEGITDLTYINSDIELIIEDENDFTATLNGLPYILGTILTEEEEYELVITDAAFNETKLTFTIDKTNPELVLTDELDQEVLDQTVMSEKVFVKATDINFAYVLVKNLLTDETIQQELEEFELVEDGIYELQAFDKAGNSSEVITVTIDQTAPTAEVEYSTTDPTNQDVIATIVNPSEKITITNNGGKNTYVFKENGSFTFEFVDQAGHVGSVTATVDNIVDKTVTFSNNGDSTLTNKIETSVTLLKENVQQVSYLISPIETELEIINAFANGTGVVNVDSIVNNQFEIQVNNMSGTFYIWIKVVDQNGDVSYTRSAEAFIVDHIAPTAEVSYSKTEYTNESVIATLINESEEIIITNNDGKREYVFTENGSFTFEFVDQAGNPGRVTATVTNIDKEAKKVTFSNNGGATYVKELSTNVSVLEEHVKEISYLLTKAETLEEAMLDFANFHPIMVELDTIVDQKFDINISNVSGEYYLWVKVVDQAGNVSYTRSGQMFLLDHIPPTAELSYSTTEPTDQDVIVTLINPSEEITIIGNEGKTEYTFTENGSYTFEFMDKAGNIGQITATVDFITK